MNRNLISRTKLGQRLALLALLPLVADAYSQTTAFTYQGRLNVNGGSATGSYDLRFSLLNTADGAPQILGVQTNAATAISNGLFTVTLDFGPGMFPGGARALEVAVRTNGGGAFAAISPPQAVTSAPYAITASNLSGTLPAAQIAGTILNSSLPPSPNFPGTVSGGAFAGNGAGLTNVNAATLGGLPASGFWRTGGNAGTLSGSQFVGTTDSQPLELKVNGARALRLEPASDNNVGFVPNVIGGHQDNWVSPGITAAVIGGGGGAGLSNTIASTEGVIAGGYLNHIESGNAHASAIGGGFDNAILSGSARAVIAGGHANRISAEAVGSAIGGGEINFIEWGANHSVIGGGLVNRIGGHATQPVYSTIAGGYYNQILTNALRSTIGGGAMNLIEGDDNAIMYATIAGGGENHIQTNANASTIGGGSNHEIQAGSAGSVIAGGRTNRIGVNSGECVISGGGGQTIGNNVPWGTVAGGAGNTLNGWASSIGGGTGNTIDYLADHSVIAGGGYNWIVGMELDWMYGTISGGFQNQLLTNANYSTIGGGRWNSIQPEGADCVIAGGRNNHIAGMLGSPMGSTIGGGLQNQILTNAYFSTIGGGIDNLCGPYSDKCFIGGGAANVIDQASQGVIGGGFGNTIQSNAYVSVAVGGLFNRIGPGGTYSFIGGGHSNQLAGAPFSFIGGGEYNYASGPWATVAGGNHNTASAETTTVAGGSNNRAGGMDAAVGGGYDNTAGNERATIGGGAHNTASGYGATVPGGSDNSATGLFSFAAGYQAKANHDNSFVWSARYFPAPSRTESRFQINAWNGLGVDYGAQRPDGYGTNWIVIGSSGGQAISTSTGAWLSDGGVWSNASDRHRKDGFAEVNPREILDQLAALPIRTWHYTNETAGVRHLGPTAQDFRARFGLGCDDKSIGTVDADGVALVAIQALNQKLEAELQRRDRQNAELHAINGALQKRLARLEALLPQKE